MCADDPLHFPGSARLDDDGAAIPTYGSENIISFARVWTGFDQQLYTNAMWEGEKNRDWRPSRGNIERRQGGFTAKLNDVDPMQITPMCAA